MSDNDPIIFEAKVIHIGEFRVFLEFIDDFVIGSVYDDEENFIKGFELPNPRPEDDDVEELIANAVIERFNDLVPQKYNDHVNIFEVQQ